MTNSDALERRVARLESERVQLRRRANAGCTATALLLVALLCLGAAPAAPAVSEDAVLRVRGLVVVDENGVERVHIGAPVPDALMFGRRSERLGTASGILLFDADGTERSGYLTSEGVGEVFFTLDASPRQQALFLANAEGGANLVLWDADGNAAQLTAVGPPRFELRRQGKTLVSLPTADGGGE